MMSAADFACVFPWVANAEPRDESESDRAEYDECIARWKDDGGYVEPVAQTEWRRPSKATYLEPLRLSARHANLATPRQHMRLSDAA